MRIKLFFLFLFALKMGFAQQDFTLPDGSSFQVWEDVTLYSKTYYVNQNHNMASDANPGTQDMPFETISKAAEVLQPGEKVIISSGIYREMTQPVKGGFSNSKMICYQAEKGARVIVSGAIVLKEQWITSISPNGQPFSHKLWQAPLHENYFNEPSPFKIENASEADIELMPWAEDWKNRLPYSLPRGMIFQNGKRLNQMAEYIDLIRMPGTFWVQDGGDIIHIHPFDKMNPNEAIMEITAYQQLFKPLKPGLSYIHINGLEFEKAGNGFPRVGTGAVFVNGGENWIIENNIVRQCNSVGIEAGARVKEIRASSKEENQLAKNHKGGFIIRNNEVYDCGTGGIQGHDVSNSLIYKNHIHHIGWQNVERYWECSAIKILVVRNSLTSDNIIHDVEGASAIWFDWDIRNSRITRNIIYDIAPNYNGAVFIEASQVPNLIDNNFFWDIGTFAVSLYDTDLSMVCNNFFGNTNTAISSRVNTNRSLNGTQLSSKDNKMVNNIFYNVQNSPIIQNKENVHDYNLIDSKSCLWIENWQKENWDTNSHLTEMEVFFNKDTHYLSISLGNAVSPFDNEVLVKMDFFGNRRRTSTAGPIANIFSGKLQFNLTKK